MFLLLAGIVDLGSHAQPAPTALWIKLVLGVLLLELSVRWWRSLPKPGEQPAIQTWLSVHNEAVMASLPRSSASC